jgi:hypothetical protein
VVTQAHVNKVVSYCKPWLIPFKSSREYPIAFLWALITLRNLSSSSFERLAIIITWYILFLSR